MKIEEANNDFENNNTNNKLEEFENE